MSLPAPNAFDTPAPRAAPAGLFGETLSHISPAPLRKPNELPGLAWKKQGRLLLLFLPFVLIFCFFPLLILQTDEFRTARIKKAQAPGTVIAVRRQSNTAAPTPTPAFNPRAVPTPRNTPVPQDFPSHIVEFTFRNSTGLTYYGASYVRSSSPFARLKPGAPVTIAYDPTDPGFNGIAGVFGKSDFPIALLFLLPVVLVGLFGAIMLSPLSSIFAARRIFRHGLLTTGRIVFVAPSVPTSLGNMQHPATKSEVTYTFQTADGRTIRARQVCDNQWLLNKLDPGSEITVAYLPGKKDKSIFLEPYIA